MKYLKYCLFSLLSVALSCAYIEITPNPQNPETNLINTTPLTYSVMKNMEGIYKLSEGNGDLGSEFVCKVSRYKVSFFSNRSGIFIILKYGLKPSNNSIQFSGFWRFSQSTTQGLIDLEIPNAGGASDLLLNGIASNINLIGLFKNAGGSVKGLSIKYDRPFTAYAKANEFMIFGHHGVQTASNPPYAENSLKGTFHAEEYGSTGIELDVRLTKDNVPILVHDPAIDIRLTKKGPLFGDYDQYSFAFLKKYVTLVDGQKIPSVEEMLQVVVDSTNLKYVWLDIKGNPGIFGYLEPVVRNAMAQATAKNRILTIFAGLPSDDVINEYYAQPTYASLPHLCELSVACALETGAQFFGPRYSEGLLLSDVATAHANGIKVISWTLNDKNLINSYLKEGMFDGFITDYPAFAVYDFYTMF